MKKSRPTRAGGRKLLVLSRRTGETLNIGGDVRVTVLGIRGNRVQIGVQAPKQVLVHREELYERIRQEKGARLTNAPSRKGGLTPQE